MDVDINAIVERIQDASELSYNYYKPLVDRIIAENASEGEVEHLLEMIASEILAYKEWYED